VGLAKIDKMQKRDNLVPVDLNDMREEEVYLAHYPKWPRLVSGYFPFRVKTIKPQCVHVLFEYAVRKVAGYDRLKGDEPAILAQDQKTKAWTHFGSTAQDVPINVGKLDGVRLAKFLKGQEQRKKVAPTRTAFALSSDQIGQIEDRIEKRARAKHRSRKGSEG
jgi:hypothetical protein